MSLAFGQLGKSLTYLFIAAAYGRVFSTDKTIVLITDSISLQNLTDRRCLRTCLLERRSS